MKTAWRLRINQLVLEGLNWLVLSVDLYHGLCRVHRGVKTGFPSCWQLGQTSAACGYSLKASNKETEVGQNTVGTSSKPLKKPSRLTNPPQSSQTFKHQTSSLLSPPKTIPGIHPKTPQSHIYPGTAKIT